MMAATKAWSAMIRGRDSVTVFHDTVGIALAGDMEVLPAACATPSFRRNESLSCNRAASLLAAATYRPEKTTASSPPMAAMPAPQAKTKR